MNPTLPVDPSRAFPSSELDFGLKLYALVSGDTARARLRLLRQLRRR